MKWLALGKINDIKRSGFVDIGYKCPQCNNSILFDGSELVCSKQSCSFDKTIDNYYNQLIEFLARMYGLKK